MHADGESRNRSMETKRMVMEDLWIDSDGDLRDRSPIGMDPMENRRTVGMHADGESKE